MTRSVIVPLLLLVSACSAPATTAIRDAYHELPPPTPPTSVSRPLTTALVVRALRSDGLRQERALLYAEDRDGLTLHRFSYRFWSDTPPRMIERRLVELLRAGGVAERVAHEETGLHGELSIAGRLLHFEQLRGDGRPARVRVALELQLNRSTSADPLLLATYTADRRAGDESMAAISQAFAEALDHALNEFIADIVVIPFQ